MKKLMLFLSFLMFFSNYVFSEKLRDISFLQTIDSVKEGRLFESKTWMKSGKVKMEYLAGGNLMITIIDGDYMYNYSPVQKTGVKIFVKEEMNYDQMGPEVIQSKENLKEFLDMVEAKKKGEEIVLEKKCDLYEYFDVKKNVLNKIWIWQDEYFPVKSIIEAGGDVITIFYKDIKLEKIDDNIFIIPGDISIDNME